MLLKTSFLVLMIATLGSIASVAAEGERRRIGRLRTFRHAGDAWHGCHQSSLAVQIGLEVLNGGNAVDAAIAVNAALGADGAHELRYRRRSIRSRVGRQDAEALRPQRQRPISLPGHPQFFADKGLKEIPTPGPLKAGRCPAASMAGMSCGHRSRHRGLPATPRTDHPLRRGGLPGRPR